MFSLRLAVVVESYASDPVLAVNAPKRVKERRILIGDRGFDAVMVMMLGKINSL